MHKRFPNPKNEQGVILIIGAVALLGVFVVTGMVLDFGLWFLTRNELQSLTDAATLAGGKELGTIYTEKTLSAQQGYSLDQDGYDRIRNVIRNIASQHQAGGETIDIDPGVIGDVIVGDWDLTNNQFTSTGLGTVHPNAVQVLARRDATANTPLAAIFGQLFNFSSFNLRAKATAALSPINRIPPNDTPNNLDDGRIIFPIGIDQDWGDFCNPPPPADPNCNDPGNPFLGCITLDINTAPANTCTAWTTFDDDDPLNFNVNSDSPMTRTIYDGDPSEPITPLSKTGAHSYYFHGDADAQSVLLAGDTDFPIITSQFLEAVVPVYDDVTDNCTITPSPPAPGTLLPIVGFVTVRVTQRFGQLHVKFACGVASTGRSGGQQDFGTWGSVPVLVE